MIRRFFFFVVFAWIIHISQNDPFFFVELHSINLIFFTLYTFVANTYIPFENLSFLEALILDLIPEIQFEQFSGFFGQDDLLYSVDEWKEIIELKREKYNIIGKRLREDYEIMQKFLWKKRLKY
jgi:hypothetical protein